MAKYMIHTYPKRLWYVKEFLYPSLLKQGIDESNIVIYNDSDGKGNLHACMDAFSKCEGDGGTWHLQDDVCICKDFKERTELHDEGIVCGFSSEMYDGPGKAGVVDSGRMWFSFPCIRIPNEYARDCSYWVLNYIVGNPVYRRYWEHGVNDDWAFRFYIQNFHRGDKALNITPNLVNHIDYLIGGGTNRMRPKPVVAQYWTDNDLIEELKEALEERKEAING